MHLYIDSFGCLDFDKVQSFYKACKMLLQNMMFKGTSKLKAQHGRVLCCIPDEIVKDLASEILQVIFTIQLKFLLKQPVLPVTIFFTFQAQSLFKQAAISLSFLPCHV